MTANFKQTLTYLLTYLRTNNSIAIDWSVSDDIVPVKKKSTPCDAAFRQNSLTTCLRQPLHHGPLHGLPK